MLAGFGRVGHRIGEILTRADKPFVALDSNVAVVEKERAKGHRVYWAPTPSLMKKGSPHSLPLSVYAQSAFRLTVRGGLSNVPAEADLNNTNRTHINPEGGTAWQELLPFPYGFSFFW